MIFVDTNVFMYAVGRAHPLRSEAQSFFMESKKGEQALVTSAEVLQELIHAYLPVGRSQTLDAALKLATGSTERIFPIESENVLYARELADEYPQLTARDLLHLSICRMYQVTRLKTFDRNLRAAFSR
jgi:predicted nucleic acid-binding protein